MFNGRMKALTFSFDDGVTQDRRFVSLLNKYSLKAAFNLNSGLFGRENTLTVGPKTVSQSRITADEAAELYRGHEIAVHTSEHLNLTKLDEEGIIAQTEGDRHRLSQIAGYPVEGMAYPCSGVNYNSEVIRILKEKTGIKYVRTGISSGNFELPSNLFEINPTVWFSDFDSLFRLGREFIELRPSSPKIFYIGGHSYELDINDTWDKFEEFCRIISGRDDIFYCTGAEAFLHGNS
ncbi:MAG: polysaccharide deacetylase family protein [Clostridia bacterium]|nr:polysaccharide deacetylase family protein [Clostridia bacterium]